MVRSGSLRLPHSLVCDRLLRLSETALGARRNLDQDVIEEERHVDPSALLVSA
jgi:hypothetical protein